MPHVLAMCAALLSVSTAAWAVDGPPNVIVILADDLGWGDVGFNGCGEIPTPNLDALAASGVVFSAGYASHPYCSPSRAGLLTGRYQQRFGHECNPGAMGEDPAAGLPLDETLLARVLQRHGYRTGAIGKWHLGDAPRFWPTERGFDDWYGFSGGGMSYWGDLKKNRPLGGVLRNGVPVPKEEQTYLTDDFSSESVRFVRANRDRPFFLYLAYNAPHAPDQVTRHHLEKTAHIEYGGRAVYGAMVAGMDEGIGRVLAELDELKLRENTLIFFYSDNGGRAQHAVNYPFRGHKGMLFEGGIRVPFCMAWPQRVPGGQVYARPISALDIFPTVLAAAGIEDADTKPLDGVDLLPYVQGEKDGPPHETLFWRYACGDDSYGYAVRHGRYKLVHSIYKGRSLLFDLEADPYETTDMAEQQPELVRELTAMYRQWNRELVPPQWLDPHGKNVHGEEDARQAILDQATRGDRAGE